MIFANTLALVFLVCSSVATSSTTDAEAYIPDYADNLDTIVVTGSRTEHGLLDSPIKTEVVNRQDVIDSGGATLEEILEMHPAVVLREDVTGAAGIQLRGFDSEHVLVLIDGRRMTGRKNGKIDLSRIPANWIEQIEIVKGPASAVYGADALGGVINIITRDPPAPHYLDLQTEGTFSVDEGGEQARIDILAGTKLGKVQFQVNGVHKSRSSIDLDRSTPGVDGPEVHETVLDTKAKFKRGTLELSLGGSFSHRDAGGCTTSTEPRSTVFVILTVYYMLVVRRWRHHT